MVNLPIIKTLHYFYTLTNKFISIYWLQGTLMSTQTPICQLYLSFLVLISPHVEFLLPFVSGVHFEMAVNKSVGANPPFQAYLYPSSAPQGTTLSWCLTQTSWDCLHSSLKPRISQAYRVHSAIALS